MNKNIILIFLCLFKNSLFTSGFTYYRPMSKKSIDFGEDVCYYEDISDNSKLMYVKGCPSGKHCNLVGGTNSEYNIHTCQPIYSSLKRKSGENCDDELYECLDSLTCTSGKCTASSPASPGGCTTISKTTVAGTECIADSEQIRTIGIFCQNQDSFTSETISYIHHSSPNSLKICKKLIITEKESTSGEYYIKSKELVDGYYSIQDGDYVEDNSNDFCQSGFSLYFFGNGKQISSDSQMFKRCVTILDIEPIIDGYILKYKIKNEAEHIYDTSKLTDTYKTNQNNECVKLLNLELLNFMKEEYKANGKSNKYIKWQYLYNNQDKYLLYKDQTEVLDYLIQESKPSYIPEELSNKNDADNTKQATPITTEETEAVESTEPNSQSSGFLNINVLIILLFLFIL